MLLKVLCLLNCFVAVIHCANILALVVSNSISHFAVIEPLLVALAGRGHNLTVVNCFPQAKPLPNYHDIDISDTLPVVRNNVTIGFIDGEMDNPFSSMRTIWHIGNNFGEASLKRKELQDLYNSTDKYDLVITHLFAYDCFAIYAHKFNAPLISIVTSTALPWSNGRVGNPDHPAYVINNYIHSNENMNFHQRIENTLTWLYVNLAMGQFSYKRENDIVYKYLDKSAPKLEEIIKRTSLVMVNSHFSMFQSRPFVPNFIEIGGIHIKQPKPLPKEIQAFLDFSPQGVIVFSLGSIVRAASMPNSTLQALMEAFSELPQRVLFKFEVPLPSAPPNVLVRKWIPQRDLLDHSNVKVLMAHGGQSSTIEAVYAGVPMIGIPLFSDQHSNIETLVLKGSAILLQLHGLTKEKVLDALNKVLYDPRYKENADSLSKQFRDRPLSALDTAVYWTEYVLRYQGAPQLRSRGADIPAYQYYFIDIAAVFIVSIVIVVFILRLIFKTIKYYLFGKFSRSKKSKKSKND